MKKFNRLNRDEMKTVLGGLRNPNDPDPADEPECMSKTKGDACGDDGGQCIPIRNSIPREGTHLICRSMPDIPEPIQ